MTPLIATKELELLRSTANLLMARQQLTATGFVLREFPTLDEVNPFLDKLEKYVPDDMFLEFKDLITTLLE